MGRGYWLRHPTLHAHQGPYTEEQLGDAIASGAFPRDSYVLRDEGQSELQRQTATGWQPVTTLLEIAPPAATAASAPTLDPSPTGRARARRTALRQHTAYVGLRRLIVIAAGASLLIVTLVPLLGTLTGRVDAILLTLLWSVVEGFAILIVAGLALALLDIADGAVRRAAQAEGP